MVVASERLRVPVTRERPRQILVTSESFPLYLVPGRPLVAPEAIAPVLDLEETLSPYFLQFERSDKSVHVYPEQERSELMAMLEGVEFEDPDLQNQVDVKLETLRAYINEQAELEVGQTLLFDPDTSKIIAGVRIEGTSEELRHDMFEHLDKSKQEDGRIKYPLVAMHGHRFRIPFSREDELVFVQNPYDKPSDRLVRASVALYPEGAFLGVVTDQTPAMSGDELARHRDDGESRFKEIARGEISRLKEELREIQQRSGITRDHKMLASLTATIDHVHTLYQRDFQMRVKSAQDLGVRLYESPDLRIFSAIVM